MLKKRVCFFTERQEAALKKQAAQLGITVAELVRRLLDAWLDQNVKE